MQWMGLILSLTVVAQSSWGWADGSWKAGSASVSITPDEPVVLLGYSDRKGPFRLVEGKIFAKALVIEDPQGNRGVIVTTDLVGVQDEVFADVCRRIEQTTGLTRRQILLNASHTHTGPLVSLNPVAEANIAHPTMTVDDVQRTIRYTKQLQNKVVKLVEDAVANMHPAELSWGMGRVGFVMNRRRVTSTGVTMGPNPNGPTDPKIPVLVVKSPEDNVEAILFGCACHNTSLFGIHNLISGDYAGYAQEYLEESYPGAHAMFLAGCGADANPEPRGTLAAAKKNGRDLADEVARILAGELRPVEGSLDTSYALVRLPHQILSGEEMVRYSQTPDAQGLMAKQMLRVLSEGGDLPDSYTAPIAYWRIGKDLQLVALPTEPVADYARLIREQLGNEDAWVAGYSNDCFGYLPTAQIVAEGGHEAIGVTLWIWGKLLADRVGFFSPEIESVVLQAVQSLTESAEKTEP